MQKVAFFNMEKLKITASAQFWTCSPDVKQSMAEVDCKKSVLVAFQVAPKSLLNPLMPKKNTLVTLFNLYLLRNKCNNRD